MEAKHRRKPLRHGRSAHQFAVAMAIMSLVLAGGAVTGLGAAMLRPDGAAPAAPAASAPTLPPGDPSNTTRLVHHERITGDISPKSVVASPSGTVIANNMMYNHTSTLYDASSLELTATVADTVDLAEFGHPERAGETTGAPVEAVFSPDGTVALVSNWCDSSVSVVDLAEGEELRQIPVDSAPRGSVVLPDNRTAYVAAMYADELYRVDLVNGQSELVLETGRKPRHLVLSPDASRMYLTESGADRLLELDTATGEVLREVETGREPRSMAISPDGLALYVVNYYANTVTKFDTETFEAIQTVEVGQNPIGITYEPTERRVWVANYAGSIDVFDDTAARDGTMEP